jgi:hypothetical protein
MVFAHTAITRLPWKHHHEIRAWCGENLGPGGDHPADTSSVDPPWAISMLRHPDANPLGMDFSDYRIAVMTKTPEHHALVRLTWC